ncbi:MAG TPA: DUF58 domain-containing protein [Natronoarchaeum rubrum]|nr:DUF58 domain-containing protein [Natronoarchaeum rubrum]
MLSSRAAGTNRWTGITALALLFGAAGLLATRPPLVLAAAVGVGYAAYARAGDAPEPALSIDRTFGDDAPEPGEEVRVTVTVRNVGDALLPDLRIVDGVPDELVVTDGVARLGTALRPGEAATFGYAVTARRGSHEFDPVRVVARGFSGSVERVQSVETEGSLVCPPAPAGLADLPLRSLTTPHAGRVSTDVGGDGIEFHSTREYRVGDPLSRVDWNRLARTGELTTVEFREERSATVTVVVDAREVAYRRGDPSDRHAVDRGAEAAAGVADALLGGGDRVGLAALGPREFWLAPAAGDEHRARIADALATDRAFSPEPPDVAALARSYAGRIERRLPDSSQVILVSPVSDDWIVRRARLWNAHGHLVTVLSPDPTARDTPGGRLAAVERAERVARLREAGLRVVDWSAEESLAAAVAGTERRWNG